MFVLGRFFRLSSPFIPFCSLRYLSMFRMIILLSCRPSSRPLTQTMPSASRIPSLGSCISPLRVRTLSLCCVEYLCYSVHLHMGPVTRYHSTNLCSLPGIGAPWRIRNLLSTVEQPSNAGTTPLLSSKNSGFRGSVNRCLFVMRIREKEQKLREYIFRQRIAIVYNCTRPGTAPW